MNEHPQTGLTTEQAQKRLRVDGPNLIPKPDSRSLTQLVREIVTEPMFVMLLVAGTAYLLLGDTTEGLFLLGAVVAVIALSLAQQHRTDQALKALRDLSAPRALVLREGIPQRIAGGEVVRDDLLILNEGDRVAADARMIDGSVEADESLLTGESVPVPHAAPVTRNSDLTLRAPAPGDAVPEHVFAGTVITRGTGLALVTATGKATAIGRIGGELHAHAPPTSRLQQSSRRLVRRLGALALVLAGLQALVAGALGASPLDSLLSGITLAMAILPEEIPVVLTVFLALGAVRIARRSVLTRRVTAIETLGSISVLAVDKTGTLTENRMSIAELSRDGEQLRVAPGIDLSLSFRELLEAANQATPALSSDPMEQAITTLSTCYPAHTSSGDESVVHEYPLTPHRLAVTRVHMSPNRVEACVSTKGAPETVFDLCHLSATTRLIATDQVASMAQRGLRVLGIARARCSVPQPSTGWPADPHAFDFEFLGLMGFADPPRAGVREALQLCSTAGVRILMLTGDHPHTARAIAEQVGFQRPVDVLSGDTIDSLDDGALLKRLGETSVCARVKPAQKLRLVRVLQQDGEIVGMTGDGVNDAPALNAADVGIAMGCRGTDVAREASALVLLDDGFDRIVETLRLGRCIFDNMGRAVAFIFAVHVPVIALSLVPLLLRWDPLLAPIHIVLFELVIDPACSIVLESEPAAADVMQRPPRPADASPFDARQWWPAVLQGALLAVLLLLSASFLLQSGHDADSVRAVTFTALLASIVLFIPLTRARQAMSQGSNRTLRYLAILVTLLVTLLFAVPWLRELLQFVVPDPQGMLVLLGTVGVAAFLLWVSGMRQAGSHRTV